MCRVEEQDAMESKVWEIGLGPAQIKVLLQLPLENLNRYRKINKAIRLLTFWLEVFAAGLHEGECEDELRGEA